MTTPDYKNVFKIARVVGNNEANIELVLYEMVGNEIRLHESSVHLLVAYLTDAKEELSQVTAERDRYKHALQTAFVSTTDIPLAERLQKVLNEGLDQ